MSIASYADLQSLMARRLHRTDLTSYIPDYIALGEARIYRDMRVRQMETSFSSSIASGVIALPSNYKALKFAYVDASDVQRLQRKDAEWIYTNYPTRSADGTPKFIAQEGSNFIFGPYPDSTYTVKGVYYQKLAALSNSNTSNWLIKDCPDLIISASMVEAADDIADDDLYVKWDAKYQAIKDQVQRESDREEFSGSILSMTAG